MTPIFFPLSKKLNNSLVGFRFEIADTPEKRIKGLSGRESLDEDAGLLFVYGEPGIYRIWMKDMNFPIDVIWFDQDYLVADMSRNIQPDSFPKIFKPLKPAKYILEVNAGFADKNGIKIGDDLTLLFDFDGI